MGTGYTRADTGNNIADGNIISAADLDGEFDAVQAAFDASTGHTHDGTTAEGAPIAVTGPTQEYVSTATELRPKTNNTYDLGSATNQWKDLYVDGTANLDAVDIDGGNIDGTVIGAATPAAGTFTTAAATTGNITTVNATTVDTTNIEVTNLKAKDGTAAGSIADSTGVVTLASSVLTTTDINGGTIDGVTIGGAVAGAITGTTGTFSGDLSLADKIVHTGDTNTAIRFPAADTVTVETNGSERMRITSTGNVGIGTSNPQRSLHIADTAPTIVFQETDQATDESRWRVYMGNSDFLVDTINDAFSASEPAYKIIRGDGIAVSAHTWSTANSERMRITSTGNVGIGRTNPATLLDVNGDVTITDKIIHSGDTNTAIRFPANDTFAVETNGSERMRITSTGNVGIGTSSPILPLDIRGRLVVSEGSPVDESAAYTLQLQRTGSNVLKMSAGATDDNFLALGTSSDALTTGLQVNNSDGDLRFRTGNAGRMRITSSGNVGINETAPDYRLDVNGTFGFTPGASVTPVDNGDVVFELTNNTTLTVKAKGSDGVVRSGTILLV